MMCPHCGHQTSSVLDSRPWANRQIIRRRRRCDNPDCDNRFTTLEQAENKRPKLVYFEKLLAASRAKLRKALTLLGEG